MTECLPNFPIEKYFEVTPIPSLHVGTLEVNAPPRFIASKSLTSIHHLLQLTRRRQGPVLYSSQGVFEAISDLDQVSCGEAFGPPLSVLQIEVITFPDRFVLDVTIN